MMSTGVVTSNVRGILCACSFIFGLPLVQVHAADRFEQAPINYATAPTDNPVTELRDAICAEKMSLEFDEKFGYLKSVLEALDIPVESQVLVFSKTSFQNQRITPETPRAIYFNDDVYIGTVQRGDVIEVSTADPNLGAMFYTLSQRKTRRPELVRQHHNCLQCHGSTLTNGVPGHVMRSVFTDYTGFPILRAGTKITTDASPFKERWGGWYVTGEHGGMRHMGNSIAEELERDASVDMEDGANRKTVDARVDVTKYLTEHSDIVALLVLGHQTHVHNRITEANFDTQFALRDQATMDEALERTSVGLSESTKRRIANAGNDLIDGLLFSREVPLPDSVKGSSAFADVFAERGPRDSRGRSLRELDLETRLFTYPLSYLIYSPQFSGLPKEMKDFLYQRLWEILTASTNVEYPQISLIQRRAIKEILIDTLPDLPEYWIAE